MIHVLYFLVCFFSSIVGGICGIGGGVIIKPVLDATGTLEVGTVSFLSGCTVLSMSSVTYLKNRANKNVLDTIRTTPLAAGAIMGGLLGKNIFDMLAIVLQNDNYLGASQAILLLIITVLTFIYTVKSSVIKTYDIRNRYVCLLIGLVLGMISAFLGIGGGPINLMILSFFFSMDLKIAAANSLYIILLSQLASLLQSIFTHSVPAVDSMVLLFMIIAGVFGGMVASRVYKKLSLQVVSRLFLVVMGVIIVINIINFAKFIGWA